MANRPTPPPAVTSPEFKLPRPDEIKAFLDEHVIGQDEAKKTLSVAVYNHYKRILHRNDSKRLAQVDKSNVILLGDTGSGKTLLVRTIAKMLGVPHYIQDCTKITASGYVGSDVEDCLAGLLRSCNYDLEKAKVGIVMLDEGDKIAKREVGPSITRDVSGECVQQSLLKIVEGDLVGVQPAGGRKHPEAPLTYLDTTNILFILSGAFVGIEDIIARRVNRGGRIGFSSSQDAAAPKKGSLDDITPQDIRDFGMIPEFVGRFPVITHVNPLTRDDLVRILTEPRDAIVSQYAELMRLDGIRFKVDKDALGIIADEAVSLGTGARGLRSVMEKVMRDVMFDAPRDAQELGAAAYKLTAEKVRAALGKESFKEAE